MKISQVMKNGARQWRVAWVQEGKQRRKFLPTKTKAEAFGRTLTPMAPAFAQFMAMTPEEQLDAVTAVRLSKPRGHTATEAVRHFQHHGENVVVPILLPKAWQGFWVMKKKHQGVRPATLKALKGQVGTFITAHPTLHAAEMTGQHLERWIASHSWSPVSRNAFLTCMRTFCTWCLGNGYLSRLPTKGIPKAITAERIIAILTVDESIDLMDATESDPGLAPYIAAGLFAGVRPAELERIRRENINPKAGTINLTGQQTKTRRSRIVHLTPNAKAWLRLKGEWPPVNLRRRMKAIREAAGLTEWPSDVLRHTFASYYLALHGLAACAMESGNSEEVLLKHYRHPVTKAQAKSFFAIRPR